MGCFWGEMLEMQPVTSVIEVGQIEGLLYQTHARTDLLNSADFRNLVFNQLDERLSRDGILSLDVFDTLVMRDNSAELTRFFEISEAISPVAKAAREDVFIARQLGTQMSYRIGDRVQGCREGSLTEIHRVAARILGCSEKKSREFISIELECEQKRLSVNPLLLEYAEKFHRKGGRVILVSDMYMHADQIDQLLRNLGIPTDLFSSIFSSADYQLSKASGRIFKIIEEILQVESPKFLHLGDSLMGDFQQPRRSGWDAMHLPIPRCDLEARHSDWIGTSKFLLREYGIEIRNSNPL
jgi:predicted HAD superfamily hydrolase